MLSPGHGGPNPTGTPQTTMAVTSCLQPAGRGLAFESRAVCGEEEAGARTRVHWALNPQPSLLPVSGWPSLSGTSPLHGKGQPFTCQVPTPHPGLAARGLLLAPKPGVGVGGTPALLIPSPPLLAVLRGQEGGRVAFSALSAFIGLKQLCGQSTGRGSWSPADAGWSTKVFLFLSLASKLENKKITCQNPVRLGEGLGGRSRA